MEFCPTCGKRLLILKNEKMKHLLKCSKCGYERQATETLETPKKVVKQGSIAVIGKEEQKLRTLPKVRVECPRCKNKNAYAWQVQTRESDQSSTQFFRCTKCNYTFREYG